MAVIDQENRQPLVVKAAYPPKINLRTGTPTYEGRRLRRLVLEPKRKILSTTSKIQTKGFWHKDPTTTTTTTTHVRDQSKFRVQTTSRLVKSSPVVTVGILKSTRSNYKPKKTRSMGAEKHEFPKEIIICRPKRNERPIPLHPHNHAFPPPQRIDRSYRASYHLHQQQQQQRKVGPSKTKAPTTATPHIDTFSDGSDSCFSQSSALFDLELEVPMPLPKYHRHHQHQVQKPLMKRLPPPQHERKRHHHRNQALTQDGFDAILMQMPDLLLEDPKKD